ncbi:imidazolonepropionase [Desulfotomaculum arcticum]|uniref:Imidazolonepropionase n=1 Tax=Desulfotruncus arcticus DSM 17038 TaxID=1121424 RepID=A0A1I2ZQ40_9FIRM|nr:imidazolonepropionase [Desulfotruncus arcticus]SFH39957.1 imidazolonepropionase [Desulfotomaculum arcticum] [Desulfotruncus arcticus DSM 17038]
MGNKIKADLIVCHADQLITMAGASKTPKHGCGMSRIGLIEDGAVAVKEKELIAVGLTPEVMEKVEVGPETMIINAAGKLVMPGLVDPHTHLVFAGSREHELELRLKGLHYLDILKLGGGILSTVSATRAASQQDLLQISLKYLDQMIAHGTTTVEAKSGYGLNLRDEIKTLIIHRELNTLHPVDLVSTFLGAHAVPEEYRGNPQEYVELVVGEMLPAVARDGLAEFCDVFFEDGVFDKEQSRHILISAKKLGFKLKVHADEIKSLGGAELAAEIGAVSADHLMAVSEEGIRRLAQTGTIAVLLPSTTFCMMAPQYAPARKMIDSGVAVALASDFNPGSSPVNNMQVVMGIACRQLKMKPAEVISAVTINAAHAIGRAGEVGSLETGKRADMVIFDAPNYQYLMYRFGLNLVDKVIKDGKVVVGG